MGFFQQVLRFFGLGEVDEGKILDYPDESASTPTAGSSEERLVDYQKGREEMLPARAETRLVIARPELARTGRIAFSLSVYTQDLREGCILLVDVSRVVNRNREEARKIVHFLSGVTEALEGKHREVVPNLYLFAPPGVNIKGILPPEED